MKAVESKLGQLLSQGKPASQTNVGWGGIPSRAVDGNLDGSYRAGYV